MTARLRLPMLVVGRVLLCSFCLGTTPLLSAQGGAVEPEQVQFRFEHPQAAVPQYSIVLQANGEGTYTEVVPLSGATEAEPQPPSGRADAPGETRGGARIHASPATVEKIFAARSGVGHGACESRQKNIAKTGSKSLLYTGGEGARVTCAFNYSDVPALNEAASTLIALAETLQAGERLATKHRFDRLGLDNEMEALDSQVKGGRALEIGNIRPVLDSIINDDRVIERVRRTAARLLQESTMSSETASGKGSVGSSER